MEIQAAKPMLFNHQKQHLRIVKIKEEEEFVKREKEDQLKRQMEQQEASKSIEVTISDELTSTGSLSAKARYELLLKQIAMYERDMLQLKAKMKASEANSFNVDLDAEEEAKERVEKERAAEEQERAAKERQENGKSRKRTERAARQGSERGRKKKENCRRTGNCPVFQTCFSM